MQLLFQPLLFHADVRDLTLPMANQLQYETSPYLLQHAHNPVDWYAWSDVALARSRAETKPILLSIGYAACHWCHVMERESFEDDATAALMNEHFICIKVDREERPDIDAIYMQATQAMTGQGGWPMTVFLTPDGEPFYAGTYFPPDDRHGMPSFRRVMLGVADAWRNRQDSVTRTAAQMRELYKSSTERTRATGPLGEALDNAVAEVDFAADGWQRRHRVQRWCEAVGGLAALLIFEAA